LRLQWEPPTPLMWVGKRVQREARNHDRPSGDEFRAGGSRHRMSTRTRTKTSPSECSMLGGAAPAPERSAATPWVGRSSRPSVAAATPS
jgi:hypothetical protein